jgi:hypothetical protein
VAGHHVNVTPIGSRLFRLGDLLAQAGKVRREFGVGKFQGASVQVIPFESLSGGCGCLARNFYVLDAS